MKSLFILLLSALSVFAIGPVGPFIFGNGLRSNESAAVLNSLSDGVAFWKMGEADGATRADSIGGNNLTDHASATQVSGIIGNAAGFDGTSQYLSATTTRDLETGDVDFTFAGWFYVTSAGTRCILSKFGGTLNEYYIRTLSANLQFTVNQGAASAGTVTSAVALTASAWHFFVAWHDSTANTINISVDGETTVSGVWTLGVNNSNGDFQVGKLNGAQFWSGRIDAIGMWKRVLTTQERANLYASGIGAEWPMGATPDPAFQIFSPAAYQISQRTGSTGVVSVVCALRNTSGDVEARWNGGSWSTVATGAQGWFTNTLAANQGQGLFEVRMVTRPAITSTSAYVGIGDVFVIAGQSNASGRGNNVQVYTHPTLFGGLYGNDYLWHVLADSTDSILNQQDVVSNDGANIAANPGSVWPIVGSYIATNLTTVPCAFIPCAMGGTAISQWAAGADHQDRTTLYGSMVYRGIRAGGCKAVLWLQGETDAINGVSTGTYEAALLALSANIHTDLGVKTIAGKIPNMTDVNATPMEQAAINTAIVDTWGTSNVFAGPDLSVIVTDDADHFKTDPKMAQAAGLWWDAIHAALYP